MPPSTGVLLSLHPLRPHPISIPCNPTLNTKQDRLAGSQSAQPRCRGCEGKQGHQAQRTTQLPRQSRTEEKGSILWTEYILEFKKPFVTSKFPLQLRKPRLGEWTCLRSQSWLMTESKIDPALLPPPPDSCLFPCDLPTEAQEGTLSRTMGDRNGRNRDQYPAWRVNRFYSWTQHFWGI